MKVLVIGGTGLISTAVTQFLARRGDDVTIYNRGKRFVEISSNVKRVVGDRKEYKVFRRQMAKMGHFDCVVDMICFSPEEAENAVRTFKGRTKQYIFCSTVDVYTKPAKHYPITEDAEKNPSASFSYAFNKAACERIFFEAFRKNNMAGSLSLEEATRGQEARRSRRAR